MPLIFFSKLFVESQDLGTDLAEATQEEIVLAMVEQRNHFSNKFDGFLGIDKGIEEPKLIARQRFE